MQERKPKLERKYAWSCICYCSEDEISRISSIALHYAYCYHDKDFLLNGNKDDFEYDDNGQKIPVEPHYHLIVRTEEKCSLNQIKRCIGTSQNILSEELRDKTEMFLYLSHEDEKSKNLVELGLKHKYSRDGIKCDNLSYWLKDTSKEKDDNQAFIRDLCKLDPYEMGKRYGRDYIKNYKSYSYYKSILLNGQAKCVELQEIEDYNGLTLTEKIELGLSVDNRQITLTPVNVEFPNTQGKIDDLLFVK